METIAGNELRRWEQLTDDEASRVRADLAALDIDATAPSWQSRIRVRPNGVVGLVVKYPKPQGYVNPAYRNAPWLDWGALFTEDRLLPPAEALKVLRGPDNPEIAIAEMKAKAVQHETDQQQSRERADRSRAEEGARNVERLQRLDVWESLPLAQQLLYTLAFELRGHLPEVASRLKAAAGRMGNNPSLLMNAKLPMPDGDWRT